MQDGEGHVLEEDEGVGMGRIIARVTSSPPVPPAPPPRLEETSTRAASAGRGRPPRSGCQVALVEETPDCHLSAMDEAEGVLQDEDDSSDTDDVIAEMCDKVRTRLFVPKVPSKFAKIPKRFPKRSLHLPRAFYECSLNVHGAFLGSSLNVPEAFL